MSSEMIAPEWMHAQVTVEQYDSWGEEQCAGIEIVDGMIVVSPSASKRHNRHNRLARILANALDHAGGDGVPSSVGQLRRTRVPGAVSGLAQRPRSGSAWTP